MQNFYCKSVFLSMVLSLLSLNPSTAVAEEIHWISGSIAPGVSVEPRRDGRGNKLKIRLSSRWDLNTKKTENGSEQIASHKSGKSVIFVNFDKSNRVTSRASVHLPEPAMHKDFQAASIYLPEDAMTGRVISETVIYESSEKQIVCEERVGSQLIDCDSYRTSSCAKLKSLFGSYDRDKAKRLNQCAQIIFSAINTRGKPISDAEKNLLIQYRKRVGLNGENPPKWKPENMKMATGTEADSFERILLKVQKSLDFCFRHNSWRDEEPKTQSSSSNKGKTR